MSDSLVLAGIRFELESLVKRAVRNARPGRAEDSGPRWHTVSEAFGVGSEVAKCLCRHFGLNPEEQVTGPICERCAEEAGEEDADV